MQFLLDFYVMPHTRFSIRLDFANGNGIGPGKIALLEAIQAQGSIGWAARHVGMCYRYRSVRSSRSTAFRAARA
jgi:hypothetical protein